MSRMYIPDFLQRISTTVGFLTRSKAVAADALLSMARVEGKKKKKKRKIRVVKRKDLHHIPRGKDGRFVTYDKRKKYIARNRGEDGKFVSCRLSGKPSHPV